MAPNYSFKEAYEIFNSMAQYPVIGEISGDLSFTDWKAIIQDGTHTAGGAYNYAGDWKRLGKFTVNNHGVSTEYDPAKWENNVDTQLEEIFGKDMLQYLQHNAHQSGFILYNRIFLNQYLSFKIKSTQEKLSCASISCSSICAFDIQENDISFDTKTIFDSFMIIDDSGSYSQFKLSQPITLTSTITISKEKAIEGNDAESISSSTCEMFTNTIEENVSDERSESGYETNSEHDAQSLDSQISKNVEFENTTTNNVIYDEKTGHYILPTFLALAMFDDEFPHIKISTGEEFINILQTFAELKENSKNVTQTIQECEMQVEGITIPGLNVCSWLYSEWSQGKGHEGFNAYITQNQGEFKDAIKGLLKAQDPSTPSIDAKSAVININTQIISAREKKDTADYQSHRKRKIAKCTGYTIALPTAGASIALTVTIAVGQSNILGHSLIFPTVGYSPAAIGTLSGLGAVSVLSLVLFVVLMSASMKTEYQKQPTIQSDKIAPDTPKEDPPSSKESSIRVTPLHAQDHVH